jgi:hypothetical protein
MDRLREQDPDPGAQDAVDHGLKQAPEVDLPVSGDDSAL